MGKRKRRPRNVTFSASRIGLLGLWVAALLLAPSTTTAGPFEQFFKKVKHAFTQPTKSSSSRLVSHNQSSEHKSTEPANGSIISGPPNERNTRAGQRVHAGGSNNGDIPYGTPVPGKKGFVTSPFAPDSGYVDVRDVAPGTPVKDPYTGKIFLTP